MYSKNNAIILIKTLKDFYPDATCSLNFNSPFQLIIATILSAQCTDERVNKTTPNLFNKLRTPYDFSKVDINELETLIRPCGFYKNKAKNIKLCSQKILEDFNGKVPENMHDLLSLPGVGRKTANVVLLEAFNNPCGIAIDTHAKRISYLIGLSYQKDPIKIEQDLLNLFPSEYIRDINHLFMWHGRNICIAKKPKCNICPINKYCNNYIKNQK